MNAKLHLRQRERSAEESSKSMADSVEEATATIVLTVIIEGN